MYESSLMISNKDLKCHSFGNFHNEQPTNTILYEYSLCSPNALWPMDTMAERDSCFFQGSYTMLIFNAPTFPEVKLSQNDFDDNDLTLACSPHPYHRIPE